jgi:threonine 3-dehydrogenase
MNIRYILKVNIAVEVFNYTFMTDIYAIVKNKPEKGASIEKKPIPKPDRREVLVKIEKAAICGTDLHIYEWNEWAKKRIKKLPLIIGHEFSGVVVEKG